MTMNCSTGGACFASQTDISCQYPPTGINGKLYKCTTTILYYYYSCSLYYYCVYKKELWPRFSFTVLHLIFNVGMNMPAVPVSNATQYIPAPGSPVDEACKSPINFTLQCTLFSY